MRALLFTSKLLCPRSRSAAALLRSVLALQSSGGNRAGSRTLPRSPGRVLRKAAHESRGSRCSRALKCRAGSLAPAASRHGLDRPFTALNRRAGSGENRTRACAQRGAHRPSRRLWARLSRSPRENYIALYGNGRADALPAKARLSPGKTRFPVK